MQNYEKANLWTIRPKPDGKNRIEEFKEENIIAIGWSFLGNLFTQTNQEIRKKLKQQLSGKTDKAITLHLGMIKRFTEEMGKGDIVMVPEPGNELVNIGKVVSDYTYIKEKAEQGYPHQREVKWIMKDVKRDSLPEKLQDGLKSMMTLYSLDKYENTFKEWLKEKQQNEITLKDALQIKAIIESHQLDDHPLLSNTYKLAESALPERLREQAEKIYNKAGSLFNDGYWLGPNSGKEEMIWRRLLSEDDNWLEEVLDMNEKGILEKTAAKQYIKNTIAILSQEEKEEIMRKEDDPFKALELMTDKAIEKKYGTSVGEGSE